MSSRISMILAVILLLGALIAGYWGLVLSRPEPITAVAPPVINNAPVAPVEDPTRLPVVVLIHDVPPFVALTAADLSVEKLKTVPAGSLTRLDQAVGRAPWRALEAGTWLTEESFSAGGNLSRMIRPDERALAVAVDEVTGAGGQLNPGDYVDVMLYLRQENGNPQPSAQTIIPALRLLGVGDQLGLTNDGKPGSPVPVTQEDKARQQQNRASARTVLLAVPEQLMTRLVLAIQAGNLRLAVRSADEQRLSHYWSGGTDAMANLDSAKRDLYQFNQLALTTPPLGNFNRPATTGAPRRSGVEVIRGNQITQQTP
ncbi:Flp pilus assembly protein CpaB [Pseudomonas sp. PDM05]|jgi:pilus assembly protein CpaB|uniref:Flp pilus assembly protein CpaB n=1 Tax=unclassified Pseudomonas TaxID=196821 RepID=UPI00177CF610|nr:MULTISPECIES: Flp pilus assembly protein CpaB [unclassified Pseudomonas]MBD9460215.1 Flp pilus assembly protein CpaB [Pseudomonas sp. PDM05]WLH80010.1 Flp pilus assembly protein CpaB [Pseudomonas sp. FP2335]